MARVSCPLSYGVRIFQWGFASYLVLFQSAAGLLWPRLSRVRSRPAPSARFNLMRFPVPGAAGVVRGDFLGASLVCLRLLALAAPSMLHNLNLTASDLCAVAPDRPRLIAAAAVSLLRDTRENEGRRVV